MNIKIAMRHDCDEIYKHAICRDAFNQVCLFKQLMRITYMYIIRRCNFQGVSRSHAKFLPFPPKTFISFIRGVLGNLEGGGGKGLQSGLFLETPSGSREKPCRGPSGIIPCSFRVLTK